MQHTWKDDTCERCKLVRVHKTMKKPIHNKFNAQYTQHYTLYYKNGFQLFSRPDCFDPQQATFNFDL